MTEEISGEQPDQMVTKPEAISAEEHELLEAETEIKIKRMRLEYYKEWAGVIAVWIQTFKTEAVSLVSGIGTLVLGWYQVRKWAVENRTEIKQLKVQENLAQRNLNAQKALAQRHMKQQTKARSTIIPTAVPTVQSEVVVAPVAQDTQAIYKDGGFYGLLAIAGVFGVSAFKIIKNRFRGVAK
jgi:hypothetical protein